MKKTLFTLLIISNLSYAQSCDCPTVLKTVIQKVETNYAGYFDKVTAKTRPRYTQLVDSLQRASKGLNGDKTCYELLKMYKKFFRDGHFQLSYNNPQAVVPVRKIDTDSVRIKEYFDSNKANLHPLEGIWETTDGSYRVALVKNDTKVAAVVLAAQNNNWKLGMVKFEIDANGTSPYKGVYWAGDLSSSDRTFPLAGNLLNIPNSGYWVRKYPQAATTAELAETQAADTEFTVKVLDSATVYVRIPSFEVSSDLVDSLLKTHDAVIRKSPHFIVDIRDNGGGTNSSFPIIFKYLNTNNFKDTYSHYRSTTDNIEAERKIIARARSQKWMPESDLKTWEKSIDGRKKDLGKMVKSKGEDMKFKEVLAYPKRVSVLMNDECYSSAEYFVYYAKQSKKVTLFGTHTGGVMDYGNVREHLLLCPNFVLRLPTTRSGWVDTAPIDNIGFQPDVKIPETEKDWVKFVRNYQEK